MQDSLFPAPDDDSEEAKVRDALAWLVGTHGFDMVLAVLEEIELAVSGPIHSAPSRRTDPRTSRGDRMYDVRRFSSRSHCARLLAVFATEGPLTDAEATTAVMGPPLDSVSRWEGCRRRCSDLRVAGYLSDTGMEKDERIVWGVTSSGRIALNHLTTTGWSR